MITGPFKVSRAFSEGWKLTKQHWLVMIGLYLGVTILTLLLSLFQGSDPTSIRFWVFFLLTFAIGIIFNAGYMKMYLVAADGEEPEFNLFSKSIKKVIPLFIVSLLCSLAVAIGFCLLIIPGIWLGVRLSFAPWILMDKEDCGIIEALKKSYKLTKDKFGPLFGMYCLFILVAIAGVACLIVGIFLAYVVIFFTQVAAMRMLEYPSEELTIMESCEVPKKMPTV